MNSIQLVRIALFALVGSTLASQIVRATVDDHFEYIFGRPDDDVATPSLSQLNEELEAGYAKLEPHEVKELDELMDAIASADGKPGKLVYPVADKSIYLASIKLMEDGEGVSQLDAADMLDKNGHKFDIKFNEYVTSRCLRVERQFADLKRFIGFEMDVSAFEPANQVLVNKLRVCWQLLDYDNREKIYDHYKFENSWVGKGTKRIQSWMSS